MIHNFAHYDNLDGITVKEGDVIGITRYKYLPLSEAIAQQGR